MELINKINNELYNNNNKQESIQKVLKICKKENTNNERKLGIEKRKNITKKLK